MKRIYVIFTMLLGTISCVFLTETEEGWIEENYPLRIINSEGVDCMTLESDGFDGAMPYFVYNDTKVLVSWADTFYLSDDDSTNLRFLFRLPFNEVSYSKLSPDRSCVAFVAVEGTGRDLYTVNIDGTALKRRTYSPDVAESFLSFSREGNKIIFATSSLSKDQTISYYDLQADTLIQIRSHPDDHRVVNPVRYFWYPCFGENNAIFYIRQNESRNVVGDSLFLLDIGNGQCRLIDDKATFTNPVLTSGNGQRIIYSRWALQNSIALLNSDGSGFTELNVTVSYNVEYSISDDGQKVLLWNRQANENLIYIINSEGANFKKLAYGKNASFSLDGKRVAFIGYSKIVHE